MRISKVYNGNLIIKKGDKRDFSQLEEITGSLYVCSDVEFKAPKLQTIGGSLDIYSDAELPKLQTIGGSLYVYSDAELPKLQTIGGSLYVCSDVEFKAPKLQTIGGYLDIYSDVEFKAPKLQTIGGYLDIYSDAEFNVKNAKKIALKFNFECFLKLGFLFADGVLAKILEKKRNVYKIQIVGQAKVSFCIEIDGQFSHGDTIKQAKEDLKYKITNRDKSKYENWTLDKKITLKQAIEMYRVVTGACETGTKHFVENVLTVKKKYYTVKEVIELTDGQYNNELLKEFFKNREGNRKCKI